MNAIVCGTDFSEQARTAALAAARLSAKLGAKELWLFHALDPSVAVLGVKAVDGLLAAADARLTQEAHALEERTGTKVRHVVRTGPAAEALQAFAVEKEAGLVIVASQGHGSAPLVRLGGTSERVAAAASLPTLVVRDAAPFEAWAQGERRLRVLLAVDWTRSSDPAIRWLKALRAAGPCDVIVGHVYYSGAAGEGAQRYGLRSDSSVFERDREAEALLARDLAARVGDLGGEGEVVYQPRHGVGRLGDHVLELADAEQVDLVVLGTHHRHGLARLGSVGAVALHHGHASVAVVPGAQKELAAPDEVQSIRRVLVPVDLSPLSSYAVPYAYGLLAQGQGEVYLLHVSERAEPPEAEVVSLLRSLVPARGVPPGVETRTVVVRHTDARKAIVEAAERLGVDVVCMSTHGRTGFKRGVLGSVTEAVMRESVRPVFVVRPLPR